MAGTPCRLSYPIVHNALCFRAIKTMKPTRHRFPQSYNIIPAIDVATAEEHSFAECWKVIPTSTAIAKDTVDQTLVKGLEHEINSAKFKARISHLNPTVPYSFPFEMEDSDYHRVIKASRKMSNGEEVNVRIDADAVNYMKEGIPITVRIAMPAIEYVLEFEINISSEDISIQRFLIVKRDAHIINIDGPEFKKLDVVLQKWLYKYLEIRGIERNMASYLLKYIAQHNKKVDQKALKLVKDFIQFAYTPSVSK